MRSRFVFLAPLFTMALLQPAGAQPLEKVKVATTFLGLWDTSQPTLCAERGEFEKEGLDVEVISTRGGSENVQAVVAGGMDVGYSPGINSVLSAAMAGAPIKIISAEFLGQNDTYFYVPAGSAIQGIGDLAGKSVAYARAGNAVEAALLGLRAETGIDFNLVATGAMDATHTMVMTGQVDVGYANPPNLLNEVENGTIRVIFTGDDVVTQRDMTNRVIVARSDFLANRRAVVETFLRVLDHCIDWAYENPSESLAFYAKLNGIDVDVAAKAMAFYKRSSLAFGAIQQLDRVLDQAKASGFIEDRPSAEQLNELIDILYSTPAK